jgi:hypothetical protein
VNYLEGGIKAQRAERAQKKFKMQNAKFKIIKGI